MRLRGEEDGGGGRSKVMINAPIWQYKSFNPVARLITARSGAAGCGCARDLDTRLGEWISYNITLACIDTPLLKAYFCTLFTGSLTARSIISFGSVKFRTIPTQANLASEVNGFDT